jgi:hypothetical protein
MTDKLRITVFEHGFQMGDERRIDRVPEIV